MNQYARSTLWGSRPRRTIDGSWISPVLIVLTLFASIAGCDGGYEVPLDDNFYLHRSNSSTVMILRRTDASVARHESFAESDFDTVVGARVTLYAVLEGAIVGHVRDEPDSTYNYLASPGWFRIDRETGATVSGLSKEEGEVALVAGGEDPEAVSLKRAR